MQILNYEKYKLQNKIEIIFVIQYIKKTKIKHNILFVIKNKCIAIVIYVFHDKDFVLLNKISENKYKIVISRQIVCIVNNIHLNDKNKKILA